MSESSPAAVWDECLEIIRDRLSTQGYKTWFEPIEPLSLDEEDGVRKLTLRLPSRFYYEWLEEHYYGLLRRALQHVLGPSGRLYYDVVIEREDPRGSALHLASRRAQAPERPADAPAGLASASSPTPEGSGDGAAEDGTADGEVGPEALRETLDAEADQPIESQLNRACTFDRFIEGDCNRLARSAAWAIAQEPGGTSFNPFLVYGGVGLGKTHLIQAIGNHVREYGKADRVLYISSERFTTEFVQSIRNNRVSEFSLFYRQIDLLIVDDIQFFGGKEKTQEEFFHIFNALHQSGKQIVLSADRAPHEIEGIEERLLSRFQWGLSSDVQPPGLETRIAVLRRKAEDDGIDIPGEVLEYIARHVKRNVRELEGALIRLLAHATLRDRRIDRSMAEDVLEDLIREPASKLTIEQIQEVVCNYFDISQDRVRARTRKREVVRVRQIAMYFADQMTTHSLKTIGLHFGGRDHSTVIHARNTVDDRIDADPAVESQVQEIRRQLERIGRS